MCYHFVLCHLLHHHFQQLAKQNHSQVYVLTCACFHHHYLFLLQVTVMPSNLSAYLRNRSVSVASSRASTLLMNPHSHHSGSHIATVGGMNNSANGANGVNNSNANGKEEDDRLSQRSTVVTGINICNKAISSAVRRIYFFYLSSFIDLLGSDQKQVYERASARPSMFARFSSTFMFGTSKEGNSRLSQLDKNMRAQVYF